MKGNKCACAPQREYSAIRYVFALVYGAVIALTLVFFTEVAVLAIGLSAVILFTVIIVPIIEEAAKVAPITMGSNTRDCVMIAILSAFGFGLGEFFFHSVYTLGTGGSLTFSITPFMHILFTLPAGYIYGTSISSGNRSSRALIAAYTVAVLLHATYNLVVLVAIS